MGGRASRAARRAPPTGAVLDRLILDTTILIAAERGGTSLDEQIDDEDDVAIAAVTAAELLVGELLATGSKRRAKRRAFINDLLATVPVEPYDLAVARAHAELLVHTRKTGTPRGAHDLQIAATARVHRRAVVTADSAGFDGLPGVTLRHPNPTSTPVGRRSARHRPTARDAPPSGAPRT
ncbi:MAG: PIN domain-containing protein, partial [Thermoleophilaceae bacterium]